MLQNVTTLELDGIPQNREQVNARCASNRFLITAVRMQGRHRCILRWVFRSLVMEFDSQVRNVWPKCYCRILLLCLLRTE